MQFFHKLLLFLISIGNIEIIKGQAAVLGNLVADAAFEDTVEGSAETAVEAGAKKGGISSVFNGINRGLDAVNTGVDAVKKVFSLGSLYQDRYTEIENAIDKINLDYKDSNLTFREIEGGSEKYRKFVKIQDRYSVAELGNSTKIKNEITNGLDKSMKEIGKLCSSYLDEVKNPGGTGDEFSKEVDAACDGEIL